MDLCTLDQRIVDFILVRFQVVEGHFAGTVVAPARDTLNVMNVDRPGKYCEQTKVSVLQQYIMLEHA